MKRVFVFSYVFLQDKIVNALARKPTTHKMLFVRGIESYRWTVGRWRAWKNFERSAKRVPAYSALLEKNNFPKKLRGRGKLAAKLETIPEMDKETYIKQWSILERSVDGKLPRRGVVADESSGSSGTPTSWVRGPRERLATRQLLQVGYTRSAEKLKKQPFIINCFSLGAWATGMNISMSLVDVAMIKSIGPDKEKVIATMQEFGNDYTYVIMSYPPFLKSLFDDDRLDWKQYDIVAGFGGEGISESMRAYLGKYAYNVYGSYGASDLEINIAIETDYTIALRQAIARLPKLADRITKMHEYGVLPMIFQFNPYDYLFETNPKGELLATIVRQENINPRIRYNIHDRGHVMRLRELTPILEEFGLQSIIAQEFLDLPLLFHYGRSDLSIDFNGAVVAPDTVRDIIAGDGTLVKVVENHRLISYEDSDGNRQLHIALQLAQGESLSTERKQKLRSEIFGRMRELNGDFDHAVLTSSAQALPVLAFYPYHTGPFREDGKKLKNEYVWHLNADQIEQWDLDESGRLSLAPSSSKD